MLTNEYIEFTAKQKMEEVKFLKVIFDDGTSKNIDIFRREYLGNGKFRIKANLEASTVGNIKKLQLIASNGMIMDETEKDIIKTNRYGIMKIYDFKILAGGN